MKYSEQFDDILDVVKSLNKTELSFICNGNFKDSPYVKYRNCLLINNEPASFVEVYKWPYGKYNFIIIATKEKFRGNHYAEMLLNKMFLEFENKDDYQFMYRVDDNNINSYKLAIKLGFKVINKTDNKIELIK